MGATSQKSIKTIIQSKYSFTHPKSHYPVQVCCWRFTEEELEGRNQSEGQGLKWPFKFYSDQGYIVAYIQNKAINVEEESSKKQRLANKQIWQQLGDLKVTVNLIELLYSFANLQIEQYNQNIIKTENKSKYIKDQLNLTLYVYAGQNLSSLCRLKLLNHSISLERYISRGGICSVSKLYHEYEQITDLRKQIKNTQKDKLKQDTYYVDLNLLVGEKVNTYQDEKQRQEANKKELKILFNKFNEFKILKKLIIDQYLIKYSEVRELICGLAGRQIYPLFDASLWASHKNLIIKTEIKKEIHSKISNQKEGAQKLNGQELNQSLPFACQITQINYKQKKKNGQMQYLNESVQIADLSVLGQKKPQFFKICCEQDDYIILTDYSSIRDYNKCLQYNIRLVINNSSTTSYNYYINEFDYLYFYIAQLPNKMPADTMMFQYNIENIIFQCTESIIHHTIQNKMGDPLNNRVAIHSTGGLFCDQNCAIAIGYLICRYLYSFEKAFDTLNRMYRQYKKSKQAKLQLHKIYADQLMTLEGRVLITSNIHYGITFNSSLWRGYQVSNNHSHPSRLLIQRYIGQMNNLNQIQSLPNHNHHIFIVISNQIALTMGPIIERWEKDPNSKAPTGITGLKILVGKQFEFKDQFITKAKEMLPLIIKYQFINRSKHKNSFNNQFLLKYVSDLAISNVQIQNIEKSFRKPQPFQPLYAGFDQQNPQKPFPKPLQPYNPKEKLTFKYPYLRPIWQTVKDDQYYFILQMGKSGASVQIVKGKNWIGLEDDKQTFFQNIVKLYLQNVDENKIWVTQQDQQSLFGDQLNI